MGRVALLLLIGLSACVEPLDAPCSSECTPGASACDGNAVVVCNDFDGDACTEWEPAATCGAGTTCNAGACVASCVSSCTNQGLQLCAGDQVLRCDDWNSDSCLEWSTLEMCAPGTCSNGACAPPCSDACVRGTRTCAGNSVVVCDNNDGDFCSEWMLPVSCGSGTICNAGVCEGACVSTCSAPGARLCNGDQVVQCGDWNADSCLEWLEVTTCAPGTCSNGQCSTPCQDACPRGIRVCTGNSVQACENTDGDACTEWQTPVPCGPGTVCDAGACVSACTNTCSVLGAQLCDGDRVVRCGDWNSDSCLEWGNFDTCAPGTCSNGMCTAPCVDACIRGARECNGTGVQVCGNTDGDACTEWAPPVICGSGTSCQGGSCVATCITTCWTPGAAICNGDQILLCHDQNSDSCNEWSGVGTCPPGTCSEGACVLPCVDQCAPSDRVCNGNAVQLCGNTDGDSCTEWESATPCGAGETCRTGTCVPNCESNCVAGPPICDGNAVRNCGDSNGDGCLEWSAALPCGAGDVCSSGMCIPFLPPDIPTWMRQAHSHLLLPPSGWTSGVAWMQAVHDSRFPGTSTVEVDWLRLYAVTGTGEVLVASGAALSGVMWTERWSRIPWYSTKADSSVALPSVGTEIAMFQTSTAPNLVWHWGGPRIASIPSGTTTFVARARIRVIGPAIVQLGIDFWASPTAEYTVLDGNNTEAGIGDWHGPQPGWVDIEVRLAPPLLP